MIERIKQGDTLRRKGRVTTTPTLTAEGWAGWFVRISAEHSGRDLGTIIVTKDAAAGEFSFYADTSSWPLGKVDMDIEYTLPGGDILHTETFYYNVERSIT